MTKPYDVLKTDVVFNGKIIKVKCDEISLPDGNTAFREVVLRGDATAIVPIDEDNNVILVKQYRHPAKDIVFEIPAGMMEEGEDPEICAIRELEEETSFKAEKLEHMISIYPSIGICTEKIHIFLAKNLKKGQFNFDDDEFIEVVKMPIDKAIDMIYSGNIIDSKTVCGLLACRKFL